MVVKLVHPANGVCPIVVKLLPTFTVVRAVQFLKAFLPILVTLGNSILYSCEALRNDSSGRDVTLGILTVWNLDDANDWFPKEVNNGALKLFAPQFAKQFQPVILVKLGKTNILFVNEVVPANTPEWRFVTFWNVYVCSPVFILFGSFVVRSYNWLHPLNNPSYLSAED